MKRYDAVLFDLDGTISASAEGVRDCIILTLRQMGYPLPDLSDFSRYIGPPLDRTFSVLCGLGDVRAKEALAIYRGYYDLYGTKANCLYGGMRETLCAIRDAGIRIAVCTSKNERLARDVCDLLEVTDLFDAICGSLDSGARKEKHDLIPYALDSLGITDPARAVMIGDTDFDAIGAKRCGVEFVGVTYGYGRIDGMKAAGASCFARTPQEILTFIL